MFEKSASFSGSYESPGVRNLKMNETISPLKNKIKILIKIVLYLLLFSKKIGEQNEKKLSSNPSCYSSWCL